jgi:hypothetical protein
MQIGGAIRVHLPLTDKIAFYESMKTFSSLQRRARVEVGLMNVINLFQNIGRQLNVKCINLRQHSKENMK